MAARLYSGIKSLHLVLDTPYDTIRTDDIRDDLVGVKVWYSKTSGFNPLSGQGTLAFDGAGLSITVSDLETNTRYYVKYAFISSIDPSVYTVSAELTALVYDENTTVYGYLTNDPLPIATAADGSGGDFSLATGVFKVFNLSQDVTGNGPVYGIKAGSNNYVVGAVIDPVTGVYSCTGISQNAANITFVATYNGVVVEQVWNIYRGLAGETAPIIRLSATNSSFVFKDIDAALPITNNTVITAQLTNLTGNPVFTTKAYTRAGVELGSGTSQVSFTQSGNTITITGIQFGALGVTLGTVIVTATLDNVSDSFTLYRINDGTEQITVELSNSAHVIAAASNGDTVPANYVGSGTTIRVKQGNTYLNVDSASPYDSLGTWNIFDISSVNITADPTPTISTNYVDFDTHASMTADQAYIDYTILYRTTTGGEGTQTVRQSFAKSKEGLRGQTGEGVSQIYIRSELQPETPLPSQGVPSGWSATVAGASGTAALWTSFGSRLAGSSTYTWQVATRVQGEAGNPLRNASGYLYYSEPQSSAPSTPSASGFNFSNGTFSSITTNWAITFSVPSGTTTKMWAVRYSVQETAFNGAQTVSISAPFTHQNFDGLVTFTNNSYVTSSTATSIANTAVSNAGSGYATNTLSNVTTIDGGKITTGSLTADRLEIGKNRTGDYIKMFDNKIVVYTGNMPRVIIGSLT